MGFSFSEPQISELKFLWQSGPTSWQYQSADEYKSLARQLVALMGNDPAHPWTVILDVDGINVPEPKTGAWTKEKIGYFAQALGEIANNVSLGFHPNGEDVVTWWVPKGSPQTKAQAQTSMVEFMVAANDHIRQLSNSTGLKLPLFNLFLGEGSGIQKNKATYQHIKDEITSLSKEDITLWSTGNYTQGVAVTNPPPTGQKPEPPKPFNPNENHPDNGVFLQIYDFNNKDGAAPNPLVGKDTDPDNKSLGTEMYEAITVPKDNYLLNPDVFKYPDRAIHTFNGSGGNDAKHGLNDAPVFGGKGQIGVVPGKGWSLETFGPVVSQYAEAVQNNPLNTTNDSPDMSVWYINNLIDYLVPSATSHKLLEPIFAVTSRNKLINRYQHNAVIETGESKSIKLKISFDSDLRHGIGLYPLLDQTGRIVSLGGSILHPTDSNYLAEAKKLAVHTDTWFEVGRAGSSAKKLAFAVNDSATYAFIADSDITQQGGLFSSLSSANPKNENRVGASVEFSSSQLGFEASPNDLADSKDEIDFDDITVQVLNKNKVSIDTESVLEHSIYGSTTLAPEINSIWMNGLALDDGTAYQIAELIVGNPSNKDLKVVVDVAPPGNKSLKPVPATHENYTATNTIAQYHKFLDQIDSNVALLSNSKIKWTGDIVYHPQTESAEYGQWAGYVGPETQGKALPGVDKNGKKIQKQNSYQAYVDWMGAFNVYMAGQGQKTFKELIFETEGSFWHKSINSLFADINQRTQNYPTKGFFPSGNTPKFEDIKFSMTSATIIEYLSKGADGNWAQAYDMANDVDNDYTPAWPARANQINPSSITPTNAAKQFVAFYANEAEKTSIDRVKNARGMVTPNPSSHVATEFDLNTHFIFNYNGEDDPGQLNHGPSFRKQKKQPFDPVTGAKTPALVDWQWNKDDFHEFISEFRSQFPVALNKTASAGGKQGEFDGSYDSLNLGIWDSANALGSWFGVPKIHEIDRISVRKDYSGNGLINGSLNYLIENQGSLLSLKDRKNKLLGRESSDHWDIIAAKKSDSGFDLLLKGASRKEGWYRLWKADSDGVVVKRYGWKSQLKAFTSNWEATFNVDINGDGVQGTQLIDGEVYFDLFNSGDYRRYKWHKEDFSLLSKSELEGIDWNQVNFRKASKSASFNLNLVDWDQIADPLKKVRQYRAIAWNKMNYKGLSADASNGIDWSLVNLRKASRAESFDLNIVDWGEVNASATRDRQYKNISWHKVSFDGLEQPSIEGINWRLVNFRQASKAEGFGLNLVDWDEINGTSDQHRQYKNIAWHKMNFKDTSDATAESINWSLVNLRKASKSDSFDMDLVDWNAVNRASNQTRQYKHVSWHKLNYQGLSDEAIAGLDWSLVNLRKASKSDSFDWNLVDWDEINGSSGQKRQYRSVDWKSMNFSALTQKAKDAIDWQFANFVNAAKSSDFDINAIDMEEVGGSSSSSRSLARALKADFAGLVKGGSTVQINAFQQHVMPQLSQRQKSFFQDQIDAL